MSIYEVTQDMILYLQMVQTFVQDPTVYPADVVLQGIYGSPYYAMLERELAQESKFDELMDLTNKSFAKLGPFIKRLCPKGVFIDYNMEKYDPVVRFYKGDVSNPEAIGFLDLPCYKFFYSISKAEQEAKLKIEKISNRIQHLNDKKDELIDSYDYTKQEGAIKVLMRMSRKENYREAMQNIDKYDERIVKQRELLAKAKDDLLKVQNAEKERLDMIGEISQILIPYGIDAAGLPPEDVTEEVETNDNENS